MLINTTHTMEPTIISTIFLLKSISSCAQNTFTTKLLDKKLILKSLFDTKILDLRDEAI